jgi:glycosyltransferase involved in cell wall biosynthesis
MSAGLPLLSTLEKGVLGRIITHNDIGYHYDCGNTNSLINAIKQIVNEAAILKIKHKVITKIFSEEFDAQVVYKQYTDHLEKVVILFQ